MKKYTVVIDFLNHHKVEKYAGTDYSIACWILHSNKVEYRALDCNVYLKEEASNENN